MALTITDHTMICDTVTDTATRLPDGTWQLSGPILGCRVRAFDRNQAITAMTLAECIGQGDSLDAPHIRAWCAELGFPALKIPAITGTPTHAVCCLYCGSTEDIYEVLITIDERTSEYASECGLCHGVWAP